MKQRPRGFLASLFPTFRRKNLAASVGTGYVYTATVILLNLALVPILIRGIGAPGYGVWLTLYAVGNWVYVLVAWFVPAFIREIGARLANGAEDSAAEIVKTGEAILLGVGGGVFLVGFLASRLSHIGFMGGNLTSETRGALLLCGAWVGARIVGSIWISALTAAARLPTVHTVQTATFVATATICGVGVLAGGDLRLVVAAFLIGDTSALLIYRRLGKRILPFGGSRVLLSHMRSILSLSRTFVVAGLGTLLLSSDILLLALVSTPATVARYGVAWKVIEALLQIIWRIPDSTQPHIVELAARGSWHALRRLHRSLMAVSTVLGAAIGTFFFILGPRLLEVWVGPNNTPSDAIVRLLSTYLFLQSVTHASLSLPYSAARMRTLGPLLLIEGILKVLVALAFYPLVGAAGPALASVIVVSLLSLWLVPRFTLRWLTDSVAGLLRDVTPLFVTAVAVTGLFALAGLRVFETSTIGLMGSGLLALVGMLIAFIPLVGFLRDINRIEQSV